jgi:hypothetical protein
LGGEYGHADKAQQHAAQQRRQQRRGHRDQHADQIGGDGCGGGQGEPGIGQAHPPCRLHDRPEQRGDPEASEQAQGCGPQPDHQGLHQHRGEHLAAAGAQRPQQRQLPGPLGDQDREGVEDEEDADKQRHAREAKQEEAEEAQERGHVAGLGVGDLLAGADHAAAAQRRLDRLPQPGR